MKINTMYLLAAKMIEYISNISINESLKGSFTGRGAKAEMIIHGIISQMQIVVFI